MGDQAKRWEVGEPEERGGPLHLYIETPMEPDFDGEWVRYSDYEKLEEAVEFFNAESDLH